MMNQLKRQSAFRIAAKLLSAVFVSVLPILCVSRAQAQNKCAEFQALVRSTYNFKPSMLKEPERKTKSAEMDKIWSTVESNPKDLLPCLRAALEDAKADPWFRFDGSSLLVKVDPSPASKQIQVRGFLEADLDDVAPQVWLETMAQRAAEGFDVSNAAAHWLDYPKAKYYLPEHGAYEVSHKNGAFFIIGCMDEAHALPILVKIVSDINNTNREFALSMLGRLATPEALQELKRIDLKSFSAQARTVISKLLTKPRLVKPRAGVPKISREDYVKAFQDAVDGNWKRFDQLVEKVPDGEKDAVLVLKAEDLPLLRKVRRARLSRCNPHAIEFYDDFTAILLTLVLQPDLVK